VKIVGAQTRKLNPYPRWLPLRIQMWKSGSLVRPRCINGIDLLGMGDMGRMYARLISKAGWKSVPTHCAF
jgi:hypothetical protein